MMLDVVTAAEAARRLDCSADRVRQLACRRRIVPVGRIGSGYGRNGGALYRFSDVRAVVRRTERQHAVTIV